LAQGAGTQQPAPGARILIGLGQLLGACAIEAAMGNQLQLPNPLSTCCAAERNIEAGCLAFNKVELAASELINLTFATAYHTSVVVNGEEFFFSDSGIFSDRALNSHQQKPSERIHLGFSEKTGSQLLRALQPFFKSGTYDLIRKNCNSFSDAAVYYLLGQRLERRFCALEKLGQANPDLLSQITKGMYTPNPLVDKFEVDSILPSLDRLNEDGREVTEGDAEVPKSTPALLPGSRVTIVGLVCTADLNGQGATVSRYNALNGRWEAIVHLSGKMKAFRAENLRPAGELVLETGDRVRVGGLKSENGQAQNGKEGKVLRYMHDSSRYEICLDDRDTPMAIKAENLQRTENLQDIIP